MPNNVQFQIPFSPQQGVTEQILAAMQMAYGIKNQRAQLALEQQLAPSQIAEREANARLADAQTAAATLQLQMRKDLLGTLTGNTPGAQPVQTPAQTQAPPSPMTPVSGASMNPADVIRQAAGQPAPTAPPAPKMGIIGSTVEQLTSDPSLSSTEKQAIRTAGSAAMLKAYADPATAMDGITQTYNDILKQHGENERAIKTEIIQDPKSNTGYSNVATHPDGTEAYRITAQPPLPKTLEEASSLLGSATLAYGRDATPGNKAAMELYQTQHDAMYADKMKEVERNARATAQARGADVEAMYRTGKNPITGETLNLNNAPPSSLVNPTNGQVIPQDMLSLYKPTQNERQTADTARQVLAIANDLKNEVTKNPDLIGPLAGRSQELLQKAGLSQQDASKMIDDIKFLTSAATKMHTGRFSAQILDKMDSMIRPGMNADEFKGALDSINDVATRYANEDKLSTVYEYQQRQQFEQQEPPKANAVPVPTRPPNVPANAVWDATTRTWNAP